MTHTRFVYNAQGRLVGTVTRYASGALHVRWA